MIRTDFRLAMVGSVAVALGALGCGSTQAPVSAPPNESASGDSNASLAASSPDTADGDAGVASAAAVGSSAAPSAVATPASSAASPPDRSMNDIRAVVAENRDVFRSCYDRVAAKHPGIKGTFTLKFVLSPDGSIKSADADPAKSQIHAPELESCSVAALKALKFPPSKRGMESTVSYPFDFNPKGAPVKAGKAP